MASKTLHGLKVLAQVKSNDKLGLRNNKPYVYKDGLLQWLWRRIDGQNKDKVVSWVERLVSEAYREIQDAMELEEEFLESGEADNPSNRKKFVARQENLRYIENRMNALIESKQGIEELKETYADDESLKQQFNILLDTIDEKVELVHKSMTFLTNDGDSDSDGFPMVL